MKSGFVTDLCSETREKELVDAFLSTRSETAFGAAASMLFSRLVRYFSVRGLDKETAEELAQDVLMIIYRKSEALRNKESFYGWLYKIARNQHLQHVRRQKHDVQIVELDCLPHPTSQPNSGSIPEETEFCHWISPLEAEEKQIMILRYMEELSYQEIATALSLPMGTVKWKLFDAKSKLTAILGQSQGRTA